MTDVLVDENDSHGSHRWKTYPRLDSKSLANSEPFDATLCPLPEMCVRDEAAERHHQESALKTMRNLFIQVDRFSRWEDHGGGGGGGRGAV